MFFAAYTLAFGTQMFYGYFKGGEHMSKTGRPIIGEKKEFNIKVRIGQSLYKELLRYCKQSNQSKAESIREALQSFLRYN